MYCPPKTYVREQAHFVILTQPKKVDIPSIYDKMTIVRKIVQIKIDVKHNRTGVWRYYK